MSNFPEKSMSKMSDTISSVKRRRRRNKKNRKRSTHLITIPHLSSNQNRRPSEQQFESAVGKVYVNPNYIPALPQSIYLNPEIIKYTNPQDFMHEIRQNISNSKRFIHFNPKFKATGPSNFASEVPFKKPEPIVIDLGDDSSGPEIEIVERRTKNKIIRGSRAADKTLEGITPERKIKLEIIRKNKKKKRKALTKISRRPKFLYSHKRLVSIGGIWYRTTRNHLIRSRAQTTQDTVQTEPTENDSNEQPSQPSNMSVLTLRSHKKSFSNKIKQRSLQILRNKMQNNNQPCLLFRKFGFCAKQQSGACRKIHDKKLVQVCKNFLQGKCLLDNCSLSHNVGPEKMPTCKYFLEGCCTREACPYLHVKLSSNNPICVEFLRGYCQLGNECKQRHIFACPEFDKTGDCGKGKFCPYPHKSLEGTKKAHPKSRQKQLAVEESDKSSDLESKKRYYDETSQDMTEKRNSLLKKVKIIKDVHVQRKVVDVQDVEAQNRRIEERVFEETITLSDSDDSDLDVINRPKRPPIGPLPAYIPIE